MKSGKTIPQPPAPNAFVLRSVATIELPHHAVVRCHDGGGEDVAWFFRRADAAEYRRYLRWKARQTVAC